MVRVKVGAGPRVFWFQGLGVKVAVSFRIIFGVRVMVRVKVRIKVVVGVSVRVWDFRRALQETSK